MRFVHVLILLTTITLIQCTPQRDKITVHIIGDSTVKNGKGDGARGLWGWGDYLVSFFDTSKVNVINHALGGTSSRTYRSKGLWKPVLDSLKPGDFVLIQFGHNDSGNINDTLRARGTIKGIGDETENITNLLTGQKETVHTYGWYLRQFVQETKQKDATPVIISPIPRNRWENGNVVRNDKDYGLWAKEIAQQEDVPFIDLNEMMALEMEKTGQGHITGNLFYERDHTHTTAKGAALNASLIAESIQHGIKIKLRKYLLDQVLIVYPAKKNVYIIGDSTVEGNGKKSVGWAKYLPEYLDTLRLNIYDYARGGRSSRTFRSEGLWDKLKPKIKSGDFVLIQFGHNDGGDIDEGKRRASLKGMGDQSEVSIMPDGSKEVVHTYGWYIKNYIRESREKGAIPIVFSQIPRNRWDKNKVERVNNNYGKWAKEVCELEEAIFIDLNNAVADKYESMGQEKVKEFFPNDHTHTNDEGARLNALTIAELIKNLKHCELRNYVEL